MFKEYKHYVNEYRSDTMGTRKYEAKLSEQQSAELMEIMEENSLTQAELAKIVGVSASRLSRIMVSHAGMRAAERVAIHMLLKARRTNVSDLAKILALGRISGAGLAGLLLLSSINLMPILGVLGMGLATYFFSGSDSDDKE